MAGKCYSQSKQREQMRRLFFKDKTEIKWRIWYPYNFVIRNKGKISCFKHEKLKEHNQFDNQLKWWHSYKLSLYSLVIIQIM